MRSMRPRRAMRIMRATRSMSIMRPASRIMFARSMRYESALLQSTSAISSSLDVFLHLKSSSAPVYPPLHYWLSWTSAVCYLEKRATAVVNCFFVNRNEQISCCFRSAICIAAYFGRIRMFLFELQLLSFMRFSTRTLSIAAELCWCTTFRRVGLSSIHADLSLSSPCFNWQVIIFVCKISVSEVINFAYVKFWRHERPHQAINLWLALNI